MMTANSGPSERTGVLMVLLAALVATMLAVETVVVTITVMAIFIDNHCGS